MEGDSNRHTLFDLFRLVSGITTHALVVFASFAAFYADTRPPAPRDFCGLPNRAELTDYFVSISPMNWRISCRTSSACFCPLIALPEGNKGQVEYYAGGKQGTGRILRIGTPNSEREPGITSTKIREDCRRGCKRTVGDLPGVEEAKRGRFAYPHQINAYSLNSR
jgi:hypothetical protein